MTAISPVTIGSNIRLSIIALDGTDVPDEAGVTVQWVSIYVNGTRDTSLTYSTTTPSTGRTDITVSTTGRTDGDEIELVAGFSYGGAEYDATSRWHVRALERGTNGANTSAPLDAAGTRSAVGLATANLDTQLSGIAVDADRIPAVPATESTAAAAKTAAEKVALAYDADGTLTTGANAEVASATKTAMEATGSTLASIKAKTDLIRRGNVSIAGPGFDSDSTLSLVRSMDYLTADGMSILLENLTTQADITGATITWRARHLTQNVTIGGSGDVVSAVEPKSVRIEALKTEIDGPPGEYGLVVMATLKTGSVVPIGYGALELDDDWQEETCE